MKLKFTVPHLIALSTCIFLFFNLLIWIQVKERVTIFTENTIALERLRARNKVHEASERLKTIYDITKKNVLFIKAIVELDILNDVPNEQTAHKLAKLVELDNYLQARLIDRSGMEVIRVENRDETVAIMPNDQLKNLGNLDYVQNTLNREDGEIFVSDIELNKEYENLETPHSPTLYIFTPVFQDKNKLGVIGLNLGLRNWGSIFDDGDIGILNSRNEVFFDSLHLDNLYATYTWDLYGKDSHGMEKYALEPISLEGFQNWTIYTELDRNLVHGAIKEFKRSTYSFAVLLSIGLLTFLTIIYKLYSGNRKILTLNRIVKQRLSERNILFKEIHHRVKNNLQVISSLLSLQSSFIGNEETKEMFKNSQNRINSMGILHEMLYRSDNVEKINFKEYLQELVATLMNSMNRANRTIQFHIRAEDVFLNLDTAIPLGLIINEIITNSLKYAFIENNTGEITIVIEKVSPPKYCMFLGDNGIGLPLNIDFKNTKSLGLKLINKLSAQLRGTIKRDTKRKGTFYTLNFEEIIQNS